MIYFLFKIKCSKGTCSQELMLEIPAEHVRAAGSDPYIFDKIPFATSFITERNWKVERESLVCPDCQKLDKTMKQFHLGDILSVTTGRLVSPSHMNGVFEILNFLTGESLTTTGLVWASEQCKSYLLEMFPSLKHIGPFPENKKDIDSWLENQCSKFGTYLYLVPIKK